MALQIICEGSMVRWRVHHSLWQGAAVYDHQWAPLCTMMRTLHSYCSAKKLLLNYLFCL
jgi:hypothetical protein